MTISSIKNIAGATGLHAPEPSNQNASLRAFEALISDAGVDIAFQEAKEEALAAVRSTRRSGFQALNQRNVIDEVVSPDSGTQATTGTTPVPATQSFGVYGIYNPTGKVPLAAQAVPVGQLLDVTG